MRLTPEYRLEFVEEHKWRLPSMLLWDEEQVTTLLDDAEAILTSNAARLRLPVKVKALHKYSLPFHKSLANDLYPLVLSC